MILSFISTFQHLQQKWKVEEHKLQFDSNSKCLLLDQTKMQNDFKWDYIDLFVMSPNAYTNSWTPETANAAV